MWTRARLLGARMRTSVRREIFPNVSSPFVVVFMFEWRNDPRGRGPGFLGLGIQAPEPSWGLMMAEGRNYIERSGSYRLAGLALMLMALAMNLLGTDCARLTPDMSEDGSRTSGFRRAADGRGPSAGGAWRRAGTRAGETLCLVGESGSGKSMTALATMVLLPPSRREAQALVMMGEDLRGASEAQCRGLRGDRVAMIFQDPGGRSTRRGASATDDRGLSP